MKMLKLYLYSILCNNYSLDIIKSISFEFVIGPYSLFGRLFSALFIQKVTQALSYFGLTIWFSHIRLFISNECPVSTEWPAIADFPIFPYLAWAK